MLAVICGEHEVAMKKQLEYEKAIPKEDYGSLFPVVSNKFFCAISCLVLCRKGDHNKYKKKVKSYRKYVEQFCCEGSPVFNAMLNVIDAQQISLDNGDNKKLEAMELYEKAADVFERQQCALFNAFTLECAGEYCISLGNDADKGNKLLITAYKAYKVHGVIAKLSLMEKTHPAIFTQV